MKRPISRPRTYSKYPLPTERYPFETHFEVLRQFVIRTKQGAEPVGGDGVEGGTVPKQAATLNVRFLASLGLLQEDEKVKGKYVPTATAIKFVGVRGANEEKARPILRSLVEGSWFGEYARNEFGTRAVAPENEFVGDMAIYAEVSDPQKKEPALRTILSYLTYTGVVTRTGDGNLTLGTGATAEATAAISSGSTGPARASDVRVPAEAASTEGPSDWHVIQTEDFYVKVRSDSDVLADLRAHLDLLDKKVSRLKAKRDAVPIGSANSGVTP